MAALLYARPAPAQSAFWKFAVSGDSRNCGDVVMPAIAAGAKANGASFYWHLGDFRKIFGIDEDIAHEPEHVRNPLTLPEYHEIAWQDFISNQLDPFGSLPVYLSTGNHDLIKPKTRQEYLATFHPWLDTPNIRAQRLHDDPADTNAHSYYHWIQNGVDFIAMDNGASDFGPEQVAWFEKVIRNDSADPMILTIVAGMHEALPESISKNHSMNQNELGAESGHRVYTDLLAAHNESHKNVYVLASHSHYFMDGTFKTEYWRAHGGILPGWIVGTAGAERYALPREASDANAAETNVYGFLLGTVSSDGHIQFDFKQLNEQDVPAAVVSRYKPTFVHWCWVENSQKPSK